MRQRAKGRSQANNDLEATEKPLFLDIFALLLFAYTPRGGNLGADDGLGTARHVSHEVLLHGESVSEGVGERTGMEKAREGERRRESEREVERR